MANDAFQAWVEAAETALGATQPTEQTAHSIKVLIDQLRQTRNKLERMSRHQPRLVSRRQTQNRDAGLTDFMSCLSDKARRAVRYTIGLRDDDGWYLRDDYSPEEIANISLATLLSTNGIGRTTVAEIEAWLAEHSLKLRP